MNAYMLSVLEKCGGFFTPSQLSPAMIVNRQHIFIAAYKMGTVIYKHVIKLLDVLV